MDKRDIVTIFIQMTSNPWLTGKPENPKSAFFTRLFATILRYLQRGGEIAVFEPLKHFRLPSLPF